MGGIAESTDQSRGAPYRASDGRERSRSFDRETDAERWLGLGVGVAGPWLSSVPNHGRSVVGDTTEAPWEPWNRKDEQ